MSKKAIYVVLRGNKWRVQTEGTGRAAKVSCSQSEAIQVGRRIAMNRGSELIVRRADGTIRSKDSYGGVPFPPKDVEH